MGSRRLLIKTVTMFAILLAFQRVVAATATGDVGASRDSLAHASVALSRNPVISTGSVDVGGQRIKYQAIVGTLVLHGLPHGHGAHQYVPTATMSYTAYFKIGANASQRPIAFIYDGGPGSSSAGLQIGCFGPRRVVTVDHGHTPPAPYKIVNNDYSLLNAADLVFVDTPATGFGRMVTDAKTPEERARQFEARRKQFFGIEGNAAAFAQFIRTFLSKYQRMNSPKYLMGESYGTFRTAVLAHDLTNRDGIDLNGIILLSTALNIELQTDAPVPKANPGNDLPYILALPSYAAIAWYYGKLPNAPSSLPSFLKGVEQFATNEYTLALMKGASLSPKERHAVAEKLHEFTSLPVEYLLKADLRVSGTMFEHEFLYQKSEVTGRLDNRFHGPDIDPLSEYALYSPVGSSIGSAFRSALDIYLHNQLHVKTQLPYRGSAGAIIGGQWDSSLEKKYFWSGGMPANVGPDLAKAMIANPFMKVFVAGGYYDLGTPFFMAKYEMQHLPMPVSLQENITYHWYKSGHMVYLHVPALKKFHADVTRFIDETRLVGPGKSVGSGDVSGQ